jgi:primosomal replication protein N
MNKLHLDGSVCERNILRFTPAGVPVLDIELHCLSQVIEAGVARRVEFTIPARAAGALTDAVQRLALGHLMRFEGFLAPLKRQSRTLIFHITDLQDIT